MREASGLPALPGSIAVVPALPPRSDPHLVQFYTSDQELVSTVADFLKAALDADGAAVAIMTAPHLATMEQHLSLAGVELASLQRQGRLVLLDAHETLARLMVGDAPDRAAFQAIIGQLLGQLATDSARPIAAFGEMVDLLWQAGNLEGALLLEELWNELQSTRKFSLLCGYAMSSFVAAPGVLLRVCATHGGVTAGANSSPTEPHLEQLRMLTSEIDQRQRIEHALRLSLRELWAKREERERTALRTERLTRITAAMAEAIAAEEVYEAVVDQVGAALGASSAGLWVLDSGVARLARCTGYHPTAEAALRAIPLDREPSIPGVDVMRTGQALWIASREELIQSYPHLATMVSPDRSYRIACLPLSSRGTIRGSLAFTFDGAPPLDESDRAFLTLVARYSTQALERLLLLEAERSARQRAESSARRLTQLSRASKTFAEAGAEEEPELLRKILAEITTDFADYGSVALFDSSETTLQIRAAGHRDRAAEVGFQQAATSSTLKVGQGIIGTAAGTGEMVYLPMVTLDRVLAASPPSMRGWLERHPPASVVAVPLRTRTHTIGVLSSVREQGSPPFTREDAELAEELGKRAASAIENGRLRQANEEARGRAELLYGLAAAVMRSESAESVFQAALDAIERALGTARAAILAFDDDGVMRFRAWRGISADYRRAVEGHSPWPRDAAAPQPLVVSDLDAEPSLKSFGDLFRKESLGALAFVPLVAAGRLIGKFMVYYDRPRALAPHELELAQAIANHVSAAMTRFANVVELEKTVKFNELFVGILGHDLRNPLMAITTAAQLALRRADSEALLKPLRRILTSGERMGRMVAQLLDFTRLRVADGFHIEAAPVDLLPLLRNIVDEVDDSHPERVLRLDHRGDTDGMWDSDRLSQLFSNLIANAAQHCQPDSVVTVSLDGSAPDQVHVQIHNLGSIDADLLAKLFEPLAGGNRRRDGSRGLGLGLFISREIARAHGGRIDVKSDTVAGTTFAVSLPRRAEAHPNSRR